MLRAYCLLVNGLSAWFILPLVGVGACEGAAGLSLSVWLARTRRVSSFCL